MVRRTTNGLALFALLVTLTPALGACEARGIGDPCIPEAIPPSPGFDQQEVYVETSSVQCRTRTCMVFRLSGDPSKVVGTDTCPPGTLGCVDRNVGITDSNSADRVFCSCRCSATSGDANTPLCSCTEGYHCVEVLTAGGAGIRGGYCVPEEFCTGDEDCGGGPGSCNLGTGVCNLM
jgi:hypothetical protein